MKYACLLWPHANARYQSAAMPLAHSELALALARAGLHAQVETIHIQGLACLGFEADCPQAQLCGLNQLAHLYLLCQMCPDGSLKPCLSRAEPRLGSDLSGILKYKGKTNEVFTRYLINIALFSSRFNPLDGRLTLFDPMCARGTTLFEALNRGFDAVGADINAADVHEADKFFKRYLEYHRIKHRRQETSLSVPGEKPLKCRQINFAAPGQDLKKDGGAWLKLIAGDAAVTARGFARESFHLIVADLPYGVQHASGARGHYETLEALLGRSLGVWRERLKTGGAAALSFNTHTICAQRVYALMEEAGLTVMHGEGYDGLEHWVEQAVSRDVAVGVRLNR